MWYMNMARANRTYQEHPTPMADVRRFSRQLPNDIDDCLASLQTANVTGAELSVRRIAVSLCCHDRRDLTCICFAAAPSGFLAEHA
jgi:hypothetical protein